MQYVSACMGYLVRLARDEVEKLLAVRSAARSQGCNSVQISSRLCWRTLVGENASTRMMAVWRR